MMKRWFGQAAAVGALWFAVGPCAALAAPPKPASPKPGPDHATETTVVMVDDQFEPSHVVFHAGVPTRLVLINRGKELHEFTAPEFLHAATIRDKRALSNGGGDIVVQPGHTVVVSLVPPPPGAYKLACADHDWEGMVGSISVTR